MKTRKNTNSCSGARNAALFVALLVFGSLLPQTSRADHEGGTYVIDVTFHRYDGSVGHDSHGGHTYRAKVYHGHHYYYIYLHSDLPQLRGHMHQKVHVTVERGSDRWKTLSVDGISARIHKVIQIRDHH